MTYYTFCKWIPKPTEYRRALGFWISCFVHRTLDALWITPGITIKIRAKYKLPCFYRRNVSILHDSKPMQPITSPTLPLNITWTVLPQSCFNTANYWYNNLRPKIKDAFSKLSDLHYNHCEGTLSGSRQIRLKGFLCKIFDYLLKTLIYHFYPKNSTIDKTGIFKFLGLHVSAINTHLNILPRWNKK
jgi:hypothetical protein